MSQQLSPFLEAAYGWNFGESGWNTGMDNNLLKFSFLFDRNVDGIVSSLPAAISGQSYFLTTDTRLYFAVGTTWYSSPTPKWFEFKIKSTGETYQFNGSSVVQVNSPDVLESRLEAVELTIANLGTAAFEDVSAFVTPAALDVVEANAQSYTDEKFSNHNLVSIADFGASPSSPDNKIAIDAALASTQGSVVVPVGTYNYSGLIDKNSLYRLEGQGVLKYKGGQIDFSQKKITPFPLTYRTVSVNLDDRDFSSQWQYWVDHLKTQGADIVLVVTCNMPDGNTGNTFERLPEAKIKGFIELAQTNGVRIVMLKPHIVVAGDDSFSRSNVLPSNEALHMTNWGIELDYYGGLCDQYGIPFLCITCEQPNQSKASLYSTWVTITNNLRTNHPGLQLTAAYTNDETENNLGFAAAGQPCQANLLDIYGQNVYPSYTSKVYTEISGVPNISLEEVKRALFQSALGVNLIDPSANVDYIPKMILAKQAFGKDVFITEIGCMNRTDALISVVPPIADVMTYKTQALLIRATMETLATMEFITGVSWWNVLGPFDYFNNSVVTEAEQAMIEYFKEGLV